ncbi:chemerin-like receptor 1 [Synchiropus splendidus]|uniref:chemerin-like receptor 1 n=1 Tax=Synchiropus splendidus TaxID=270530 RepID=UPI00237DDE37|nr:chemerin-like receptor 1 [Synchiropus splendidus]XP_053743356.1 chemerin-like receptor 1 [Synchiropus splendidus]
MEGSATPTPHGSADESDAAAPPMHPLTVMSLIVYCLAFVLGVLGNGVVIWVTGFKMKKTANTVWFLNLAVADFLFTAFLPLSVTYAAMGFHWPFGQVMCKLNSAVSSLNMFASVFTLMVISVDRCICVVRPIWAQNNRSARKASWACLAIWAASVLLCVPMLVFRDTITINTVTFCFNNFELVDPAVPAPRNTALFQFRLQAMTITRFVLAFLIPFPVIICCYAVIIHRLRKRPSLASQSTRTFKLIAAVVIAFFLCWVPFHSVTLLEIISFSTGTHPFAQVLSVATPIATSLAYFNSCLNPLLYVFVGRDFKEEIGKCKSLQKLMETALWEDGSHGKTTAESNVSCDSEL